MNLTCSVKVAERNARFHVYISFFFNDTATTEIYTLSLHDALPISAAGSASGGAGDGVTSRNFTVYARSEEHTSELQSRSDLVCRLLLEKKKKWRTQLQTDARSGRRTCARWRSFASGLSRGT